MDIRMYETEIKEYLHEFTRYGKTPPPKKELAKLLGVTEGCLNHWISGRRKEPETVKQYLKLLRYLKTNARQVHDRIWRYSLEESKFRERQTKSAKPE